MFLCKVCSEKAGQQWGLSETITAQAKEELDGCVVFYFLPGS